MKQKNWKEKSKDNSLFYQKLIVQAGLPDLPLFAENFRFLVLFPHFFRSSVFFRFLKILNTFSINCFRGTFCKERISVLVRIWPSLCKDYEINGKRSTSKNFLCRNLLLAKQHTHSSISRIFPFFMLEDLATLRPSECESIRITCQCLHDDCVPHCRKKNRRKLRWPKSTPKQT